MGLPLFSGYIPLIDNGQSDEEGMLTQDLTRHSVKAKP